MKTNEIIKECVTNYNKDPHTYEGSNYTQNVYAEQLLLKFSESNMMPKAPTYQSYEDDDNKEENALNWVEEDEVEVPESR